MKNILKFMLFALMAVSFAACSDSEDYNADTAVSPYRPVPGRRLVAQVKTTNTIEGRDYSWVHDFEYDAQGRIRQIDSKMVHHRAQQFENKTRYYKCNITSQANYYYYDEKLHVEYSLSREYPDYKDWNTAENGKDKGVFNSNGTLVEFSSIDLEYNMTQLQRAFNDANNIIAPTRDASGNVTGYVKYMALDAEEDTVIIDRKDEVRYSATKNKTNFDFSAYFGYWGVEQAIYANRTEYYASYQLAAFGMLGATSAYLPLGIKARDGKGNVIMEDGATKYLYGKWEFDGQGCPTSYTDGNGRRTEIKYVD